MTKGWDKGKKYKDIKNIGIMEAWEHAQKALAVVFRCIKRLFDYNVYLKAEIQELEDANDRLSEDVRDLRLDLREARDDRPDSEVEELKKSVKRLIKFQDLVQMDKEDLKRRLEETQKIAQARADHTSRLAKKVIELRDEHNSVSNQLRISREDRANLASRLDSTLLQLSESRQTAQAHKEKALSQEEKAEDWYRTYIKSLNELNLLKGKVRTIESFMYQGEEGDTISIEKYGEHLEVEFEGYYEDTRKDYGILDALVGLIANVKSHRKQKEAGPNR